jgi:sugar phosphate isomerase/epimerase
VRREDRLQAERRTMKEGRVLTTQFEIGVMLNNLEPDRLRAFRVAADLGFQVVHTSAIPERWLTGPERSQYIAAAQDSGLIIDTMFAGFDGQSYRDIPSIRRTVGLVLPELREHRTRVALAYCDLAAELGVKSLAGHLGFLPEEREHPDYRGTVAAVQRICERCAELGQSFHLETGQESAERLLLFIADVNRTNLGVNFDPANFLLYGTDTPSNSYQLLRRHLRAMHCKDAFPPAQPDTLGTEVPIGYGDVPFETMLLSLRMGGYQGPLIIEREQGPNVVADVLWGREYLRRLTAQ